MKTYDKNGILTNLSLEEPKKIKLFSQIQITFIQPKSSPDPKLVVKQLFYQALYMIQNKTKLTCLSPLMLKEYEDERTRQLRTRIISDPEAINRDSQEISKRGRLGSIRSS